MTATNDPSYLASIRQLIDDGLRFNLLSGEHSGPSWGVPTWVRNAADRCEIIEGVGHLMMVEAPSGFATTVLEIANTTPSE